MINNLESLDFVPTCSPATNFFQLDKGYVFGESITDVFAVKTTKSCSN